uniref:Uncharacterized protein n=1 Tax=Helianthus annuus TaxID=4232 RepID=A0A251UZQ0_HELAN
MDLSKIEENLFSFGEPKKECKSSRILRTFDDEAQAMKSARNSSRMLEEATATGTTILAKYTEQRDHLKVAKHKYDGEALIMVDLVVN